MSQGSCQMNLVQEEKKKTEKVRLLEYYKLSFIIIHIFNSQKLYHK